MNGSTQLIPNAQNLPVGLVTPSDITVGTASAIVQYDIGKSNNVGSVQIVVIVGGDFFLNDNAYDQVITIAKPGLVSSFVGGGAVNNAASPISSGYVGNAPLNNPNYYTTFEADVQYNKSGTNPRGKVTILVKSNNRPDGSVDPDNIYTYQITSNAISELQLTGLKLASFSSKVTVKWLKKDGTVVTIDSGNMLQMTMSDNNNPDTVGITVQKSTGGLWYSSGWGAVNGVPTTVEKPILNGNFTIQ